MTGTLNTIHTDLRFMFDSSWIAGMFRMFRIAMTSSTDDEYVYGCVNHLLLSIFVP